MMSRIKPKTHWGILLIAILLIAPATGAARSLVASSTGEFSDIQGQDGWEYGYYLPGTSTFTTAGMQWVPSNNNLLPVWQMSDSVPAWALGEIGQWGQGTGCLGPDPYPGIQHVTVRRWTSDFKGPVTIEGHTIRSNDQGNSFDDGYIHRILHNGLELYSRYVSRFDLDREDFLVNVALEVGDIVDFTMDPINTCVFDGGAFISRFFTDYGQLIENLVEEVINLNLSQNISNSLDAKLDAALAALDDFNDSNNVAALGMLNAFIQNVEAQRGNKLSDAQADELVAAANEVIALLPN